MPNQPEDANAQKEANVPVQVSSFQKHLEALRDDRDVEGLYKAATMLNQSERGQEEKEAKVALKSVTDELRHFYWAMQEAENIPKAATERTRAALENAEELLSLHPASQAEAGASEASYVEKHGIPDLPQRQDATQSQLADLKAVAERLGMYDAADLLKVAASG